jgi:hypothetical protein
VTSHDGGLGLSVSAHERATLGSQLFGSLEAAVEFFRQGSLGFSPSGVAECLAGVRLECQRWDARPVSVDSMISSIFDDATAFPEGSCTLDCGLVMRDLKSTLDHRRSPRVPLRADAGVSTIRYAK